MTAKRSNASPATQDVSDAQPTETETSSFQHLEGIPQPILNHLRLLETGSNGPDFARFYLSPRIFAKNRQRLEDLPLRFDFHPRGIITFKMPSPAHWYHTRALNRVFEQALKNTRSNNPDQVTQIFNDIQSNGDLVLSAEKCKFQPNGQFCHSNSRSPGLVFEVGFAQSTSSLKAKAKDIIYNMEGEVTTVVCFDIAYPEDGASTVFVYRAHYAQGEVKIKCDMEPTVFHTASDGAVNPEKQLVLNLKDFAFPEVSNNWPSVPILIKFEAIAKARQDAQKEERANKKALGGESKYRMRTPSSSSGDSWPSSISSAKSDPRDFSFQGED